MIVAFIRTESAAALPEHAVAQEISSDEVLIRQIAGGDQLAMQILFARHRVALYREALAENLLSDVFLDVWRQAAKFEARSSVSTWLMAIARYKGLSARRRRIDAEFGEEVAVIIADPADNPELVLQKKNQAELVRHSLARLCLSTARSSTLFTITANRSERLPRLSESPRPRSRRACSMRAKN